MRAGIIGRWVGRAATIAALGFVSTVAGGAAAHAQASGYQANDQAAFELNQVTGSGTDGSGLISTNEFEWV